MHWNTQSRHSFGNMSASYVSAHFIFLKCANQSSFFPLFACNLSVFGCMIKGFILSSRSLLLYISCLSASVAFTLGLWIYVLSSYHELWQSYRISLIYKPIFNIYPLAFPTALVKKKFAINKCIQIHCLNTGLDYFHDFVVS